MIFYPMHILIQIFTRYLRYMHAESLGSLDLIVVGTDEARAEGGDQ